MFELDYPPGHATTKRGRRGRGTEGGTEGTERYGTITVFARSTTWIETVAYDALRDPGALLAAGMAFVSQSR